MEFLRKELLEGQGSSLDRSDMFGPLGGRGELNQTPGCGWRLFAFASLLCREAFHADELLEIM